MTPPRAADHEHDLRRLDGGMLVIGPGGHLARATAHAARDRGARVVLATPDGGEDADAHESSCFSVDVGSEDAVEQLFDRVAVVMPDLGTVVVVAAPPPLAAVHELSREQWRASVDQPLRRVFWLVRRAIEGFLADGVAGRLVLVTDCFGEGGGSNPVVATALQSLVRSIAREYGRRGLACNLVTRANSLELSHAVRAGTNGHGRHSSIVEQVLFLASRDASFVNGEALVVR
jgi:NAD(P)-dependent dehydrogenase (short-subunit alcohol dehydrogenase family)